MSNSSPLKNFFGMELFGGIVMLVGALIV